MACPSDKMMWFLLLCREGYTSISQINRHEEVVNELLKKLDGFYSKESTLFHVSNALNTCSSLGQTVR